MHRKYWYLAARILEVRAERARRNGLPERADALSARAEENFRKIDALPARGPVDGDPAEAEAGAPHA